MTGAIPPKQRNVIAQAACSQVISASGQAPTRFKLMPAGSFTAHDGRPANLENVTCAAWVLTDSVGAAIVQAAQKRQRKFVIDYEHATMRAKETAQPAPAAGWFKTLEYVPGDGLYAVDVQWTARAAAMLAADEYLYISPVFPFNKHTGLVAGLHSVALTNDPGLDMLPELAQLSATSGGLLLDDSASSPPTHQQETSQMDKLAILAALGLPASTTDDTALTALAALRGQVAAKDKQIEALTAGQFDPAKHIPLVEHQKVAEQLAQLTAQSDKAQHDQLMTAALADARILPANEAYWRGQPLAALQAFLKDAKPIAALGTLQTGGTPPVDTEVAQLTAEESTVCKMLGITAEDFLKSKAA